VAIVATPFFFFIAQGKPFLATGCVTLGLQQL
jgi:hypothetical protein